MVEQALIQAILTASVQEQQVTLQAALDKLEARLGPAPPEGYEKGEPMFSPLALFRGEGGGGEASNSLFGSFCGFETYLLSAFLSI